VMNINKMLKEGYLLRTTGRTEVLTPAIHSKCLEIQSLNAELKDVKLLIDGSRNHGDGYKSLIAKHLDDKNKGYVNLCKERMDECEKEIIILKTEIKQKKKELQSHKEFNIRIDESVRPYQTYDLTKDEMPCRKPHMRFNNGDYHFFGESDDSNTH